jgi:hypothetical protein
MQVSVAPVMFVVGGLATVAIAMVIVGVIWFVRRLV